MLQKLTALAVDIQAGPGKEPGTNAGTNPGITPNTTGLPGLGVLKDIVGALVAWGLVAAVAALVVSAAALGFAKVTNRGGMADQSKTGVLYAALGAIVLGGANAIIAFFADTGATI
ncbi:hypothetical protein CLV30_101144 [Haloactinopolyspora alba]|uniref:TrbC/VIRB2 family protein n=1 Tax=Haloactinopolyspora alba TaxID=648780 RepID=A0A2P8EFC8_9ACTN|nr:DUF6112 family protein [Haloactinopolyspora alba]PSL08177.1 hypothetical protein CLV30_101144 [Haloactinopolyspora alba]